MDLSAQIFSPGMAYVALSRVKRLENLHLISFTPKSIMVSTQSLQEINRLRKLYRPDLPEYPIPKSTKPESRKRKFNSHLSCDSHPLPKQAEHVATKRKMKDVATESKDIPPLNRPCCHSITTTATNPVIPRFNPLSQEWQQMICARLQLKFICQNSYDAGGSTPNSPKYHTNNPYSSRWELFLSCLRIYFDWDSKTAQINSPSNYTPSPKYS